MKIPVKNKEQLDEMSNPDDRDQRRQIKQFFKENCCIYRKCKEVWPVCPRLIEYQI